MGTGDKTQSILHFNAYGWFERVDRGVYALTAQGRAELDDYPALKKQYYPKGKRTRGAANVRPGAPGSASGLRARALRQAPQRGSAS